MTNTNVLAAGEYRIGDITLHSSYWDCECKAEYIHPKAHIKCMGCGVLRDDQPDSRANEVRAMLATMSSKPCELCNASRMGSSIVHKPWCKNFPTSVQIVNFDAKTGDKIRWNAGGAGGYCIREVVDTFPNHIVVTDFRNNKSSLNYKWLREVRAYYA